MKRFALISIPLLLLVACEETPQPVTPGPAGPSGPPVVTAPPIASAPPGPPQPRTDPGLIARKTIFGNPDRAGPSISPDGKQIAFTAPDGGVMNVWVAPSEDPAKAKVVTHEKGRPIRGFQWALTGDKILYANDKNGDENFHVMSVDLKTGDEKDLTPFPNVRASIAATDRSKPGVAILALNKRDPQLMDLYEVDLKTNKLTEIAENTQGFAGWVTDNALKARFGVKVLPDGSQEIFAPGKKKDEWTSFLKIPNEDSLVTNPIGFDKTNKKIVMIDSRGRDTGALVEIDATTGKASTVFESPKADVSSVLVDPKDYKIQAVSVNREREEWSVLDKSIAPDLDALKKVASGDVEVLSRSLDDKRWTVAFARDDGPIGFYLYDRDKKKATFLYSNRKALESVPLTKMHPVVIKSRDGLDLVSYLSLPKANDHDGKPDHPLSMVLYVHGGPWARDAWGYNPVHQWLANRGYAVLSVNFRASTGFGKKFTNAGDKEWAGKMQNDLDDAVKWAIDQKIADPAKVAIMGGSYGGYATLTGLAFTPDEYACGVDIVGPSNLVTLLNSIPAYWAPQIALFAQRVGDHRTEEGKKFLFEHSALARVDAIKKPLLIGQGANDPRVKQAESDQIVKALQGKKVPVTYVLYPDEGHGFARPENRTSFYAVAEIFLAQYLGGTYEPIGADFGGSSITVPSGADQVYSLPDSLPKK